MGRKKRRSSIFKDSSTVIDMEQARKERQQRHEKRSREARDKQERQQQKQERRESAKTTRSNRPSGWVKNAPPRDGVSGERLNRRKMALRKRKRTRSLVVVGVLVALVVLVGISLGNIVMLKHDLHVAYKQQEQYEEEKAQMEKDVEEKDDLQNLEEQARDQMRMIRPGETLYIFPDQVNTQQSDDSEMESEADDMQEADDAKE